MIKKETLLQKALKIKHQKRSKVVVDKDLEEAALAWCRDEISITQIARAMGLGNTGYRTYAMIAHALKKYLNKNHKI